MSLFGGKPVTPASKPAAKPSLFSGGRQVPIKQLIQQAKKSQVVIPGTGGQKWGKKQFESILKQKLPYTKVKTHLTEFEARNILRKMRREDKGNPSRERRTLEQNWGLKGKY